MLRLEIEGRWEPENFIQTLEGIESLYYKAAIKRLVSYETSFFWYDRSRIFTSYDDYLNWTNDWLLARARITARPFERLTVAGIQYGSPGFIDLLGFGEACRALEGIVCRLISFFEDRNLRKQRDEQATIDTALKELELEAKEDSLRTIKWENAGKILELCQDYAGLPEDLLRSIVTNDQDKIISLIAEGKLVGISTGDSDPDLPQ